MHPFLKQATLIYRFSTTYIHPYHAFKSRYGLHFFILKMYIDNFKEYRKWYLAFFYVYCGCIQCIDVFLLYKWQVVNCLFTIQNVYVFWYMFFFYIDIIFFNKHPNILEMLTAKERYCTLTLSWHWYPNVQTKLIFMICKSI